MYAQCNSSDIVITGPNIVVSKTKLGMVVIWIDIVSIIIIILFAKIIKWRQAEYVKLFNQSTIKISDFTIRVKNLPLDREFDGDESVLQAQLWEHFTSFLENNIQDNQDLNGGQNDLQIADITFAKQEIKETAELIKLYDTYLNLQNLLHQDPDREDNKEAFEKKIQKAEQNYINERKNFSIYQKFQEKKEILRASLRKVKNFQNAQDDMKNSNKKSIRYAFVTFRSMKALNSVLNSYKSGYFDQFLSFNCCRKQEQDQSENYRSKLFYNRRLNVQKASQPDEIKWENFGYHGHLRLMWRIIVWLIALGLIAGDIFGMVALKYQNDKFKSQFNFNQVCPIGFTKSQAYSDFVDNNSSMGLMGCYCQQQFNLDIASVYSIQFTDINPDDESFYCLDWFSNQTKQNAILIAIALFIVVFNLLISKILELISSLERHHTEDDLSLSQFQKILITNFTNLAVVILLVNFNDFSAKGAGVSYILNGDYSDFSVQWYRNIGTSICITLVINIFSPYMLSLLKYITQNIQRCKDRRFRKNLKLDADEKSDRVNTRLILQSDLQNLYTGTQIQTHYVYAAIFSNFWAILMYSSGFPVLYLVAFLFYTVLYWVYKFFLIKFFQKTSKSNENLAIKSMSYIKYGIIIHMVIGGLMYTNISILTPIYDDKNSEIDLQDAFDYTGALYLKGRFTSNFSKIYLAFFFIFIFLFIVFDYTVAKVQNFMIKFKVNKQSEDGEQNDQENEIEKQFQSKDVLLDMKVSCLAELYKRSLLELNLYSVTINENKEFISLDMKNKHQDALKIRVQSIEQVIDDHLSKLLMLHQKRTKNQQNLNAIFNYNYRQKLHIIMANEHALLASQFSKDRLRMIGITQSYHINDSQQYQKAKKMMKILSKEGQQQYQLQQIIQDSDKKALF